MVRRSAIAAIGFASCVVLTCSTVGAESGAPGTGRKGETLTSGSFSLELPLGLQAGAAYVPESNPLTAEKIALGRLLYFDPRLSNDRTLSCASCHNPYHGFADPARTSKGLTGKFGMRNSPTVINRLFSKEQFWDGRAEDLEAQAKGPLVNPVEMQMASLDAVVSRVKDTKGYAPLFRKAFGDDQVTIDRVAQAIASYERTVVSGDSPYDRYTAGDQAAMSASAVRGLALFNGKANCKTCHTGFNFTDESYHNLGVGMTAPKPDVGRSDISKADSERGAFKTPTLRNVTLTAPYMHDGSEATLRGVIQLYNRGGVKNPTLSKEIKPLGLTPGEVGDLVAFLEALTADVRDSEPPAKLPE
jgi:cytochrome c peroxidase